MITTDILSDEIRVQTPFVQVKIGGYVFGSYEKKSWISKTSDGSINYTTIQYPNFIQTLQVEKINGTVNTYTLNIAYGVTHDNDVLLFDKVFGSIATSREITFSYGDCNAPAFVYREEQATVTDLKKQVNFKNAQFTYVVTAVSNSNLASVGAFNFPGYSSAKPSDIIKSLLKNNTKYGLLNLFTGMRDMDLVLSNNLIASDDKAVKLEAKRQLSILEYIGYLVESMIPISNSNGIYVFKVVDDNTEEYGGPYFKVINSDSASNSLDTYELNIGFDDGQTNTAITDFTIDDNEGYTIYFEYQGDSISTTETVEIINDDGEVEERYSNIGKVSTDGLTSASDQTWIKNVTEYPISVSITLRGLLRPAILMSKLQINAVYFGQVGLESGTYVINKQVDSIGISGGYYTTLSAVRIGGIS